MASQEQFDDYNELFVQRNALALHICAGYGLDPILLGLTDANQDINACDPFFERPPLIHAIRENQQGTALQLIDQGASLTIEDADGYTALIAAVVDGQADVVEAILQKVSDVDVNKRVEQMYDRAPLTIAVTSQIDLEETRGIFQERQAQEYNLGVERIVQVLLDDKRTDTSLCDRYGQTALMWATQKKSDAVFELFFDDDGASRVDLNVVDSSGETALHTAARTDQPDRVRRLVEASADVNVREHRYGRDFLGKALVEGNCSVLEYVLGGDFEATIQARQEPRTAVQSQPRTATGHKRGTSAYHGFDTRDKDGKTLLHLACINGWDDCVQLLLEKANVDVNARDNDGATPLHGACELTTERPVEAIMQLLITHQARTDIHDKLDRLAKTVAWQCGHAKLFSLLESKEATAEIQASANTQTFVDDSPSGNYPDIDQLPSWSLARIGLWDALTARVQSGMSMDSKDPSSGWDALFWTVLWGDDAIMYLGTLLASKVDVSSLDRQGQTALFVAVSVANTGEVASQTVELLLEHGVDPDHYSDNDETALYKALNTGLREESALLIAATSDADLKSMGQDMKQRGLAMATAFAFREAVEKLCKAGANPWMTDQYGLSPRLRAKLDRDHETLAILEKYSDLHSVAAREKQKPVEKPFAAFFQGYLAKSTKMAAQRKPLKGAPVAEEVKGDDDDDVE